mmetsp:Transcript_16003/g.37941  ORF Transcript_16003/g.37941 Transcript_16003/m.37941 type:complete len:256 (-) Transcript_16003:672-1439(-)
MAARGFSPARRGLCPQTERAAAVRPAAALARRRRPSCRPAAQPRALCAGAARPQTVRSSPAGPAACRRLFRLGWECCPPRKGPGSRAAGSARCSAPWGAWTGARAPSCCGWLARAWAWRPLPRDGLGKPTAAEGWCPPWACCRQHTGCMVALRAAGTTALGPPQALGLPWSGSHSPARPGTPGSRASRASGAMRRVPRGMASRPAHAPAGCSSSPQSPAATRPQCRCGWCDAAGRPSGVRAMGGERRPGRPPRER